MKSEDENRVIFGIYDFDCSPEEITEILKVTPTKVEKKGEETAIGSQEKTVQASNNAWVLESDIKGSHQELLESILTKLQPVSEQIKELAQKYHAEISFVTYSNDPNMGLHIERSQMEILASMRIELDIDFYYME